MAISEIGSTSTPPPASARFRSAPSRRPAPADRGRSRYADRTREVRSARCSPRAPFAAASPDVTACCSRVDDAGDRAQLHAAPTHYTQNRAQRNITTLGGRAHVKKLMFLGQAQ